MIRRQNSFLTAAAIFGLLICVGCQVAVGAEPKRVLLLHPNSGSNLMAAMNIRAELERQWLQPLEVYDASLVTGRPLDEIIADRYGDYLRSVFPDQRLDLAVAVGGASLRLFQRYRPQLFPSTPLLAVAEESRFPPSNLPENETRITTTIDHAGVIENLLQVLPETTSVAVVIGNSPIEQYYVEQMRVAFRPFANRVSFIWLNDLVLEAMLNRAATLPSRSAIYFAFILADAAAVALEENTVFPILQSRANAPIFSFRDLHFGSGIVGGPLISAQERNRKAAGAAVRILRGETPRDIKIPPIGISTPKFDWREMQRWGISESRLPPGSEVLFREPTAWERYSWQISATAAALLLQAVMIAGLLYEHRRRRKAEIEARQRMSELAHMNRHATAGELSASIAHELNQPLGAILNNAETATIILNSPSPNLDEMKTIVEEIRRDDKRATEVILRLRRLLKKTAFETQNIDLNEKVRQAFLFLSVQAAERNVTLNSSLAQGPLRISGDRVQLQQVILNLVINAMDAMAGAVSGRREVTCSTSVDAGSAKISIADSGPGIPLDKLKKVFEPFFTTKGDGMGMGLSIARSIVEAHRGTIWAENHPGGGAVFHVSIPLAKTN
jgi:signal transduction histidine kinase